VAARRPAALGTSVRQGPLSSRRLGLMYGPAYQQGRPRFGCDLRAYLTTKVGARPFSPPVPAPRPPANAAQVRAARRIGGGPVGAALGIKLVRLRRFIATARKLHTHKQHQQPFNAIARRTFGSPFAPESPQEGRPFEPLSCLLVLARFIVSSCFLSFC